MSQMRENVPWFLLSPLKLAESWEEKAVVHMPGQRVGLQLVQPAKLNKKKGIDRDKLKKGMAGLLQWMFGWRMTCFKAHF